MTKTKPQIVEDLDEALSHEAEAPDPQSEAFSSRSSRVITMAKTNPLLPLSVAFVFASVSLHLLVFIVVYFGLVGALVCMLIHSFRPRSFPLWFRKIADYFILQLQEKPIEAIAFLGLACGALLNQLWPVFAVSHTPELYHINFPLVWIRELLSCVMVTIAFIMFGYKPRRHRTIWELFKPKQKRPHVQIRSTDPSSASASSETTETPTQQADNIQHQQWEKKQQERWENWLEEEVERLDGDKPDSDQ